MFSCSIKHVSGDGNVWGDLLSRWITQTTQPRSRLLVSNGSFCLDLVVPLQDADSMWPTTQEVLREQQLNAGQPGSVTLDSKR